MKDPRDRLIAAFGALLLIVAVTSIGLYVIGGGKWPASDCVYFTFITLTTVGFAETLPGFSETAHAREFVVLMLVFGMGSFLYFVSTLTASIIEGDLQQAFRRNRMHKKIEKLRNHVVVCGAGSTGQMVMTELLASGVATVVIDHDAGRVESLASHYKEGTVNYIVGDATDDEILEAANVRHAQGLVAALAGDKDNLYLVVAARQSNPSLRIVARGSDLGVLAKLRKAGANAVVSPNYIGGLRMVSELIRPQVVAFLDEMLRDENSDMRIDEVAIAAKSKLVGQMLKDTNIRKETDVLVLATKTKNGKYSFNPGAEYVVEAESTLVVLGPIPSVAKVRELAQG